MRRVLAPLLLAAHAAVTGCLGGQTGSIDEATGAGDPVPSPSAIARSSDLDLFDCSVKRRPLDEFIGIGFEPEEILEFAEGEHGVVPPGQDAGSLTLAVAGVEDSQAYRIDGSCVVAIEIEVRVTAGNLASGTGPQEAHLVAEDRNTARFVVEVGSEEWIVTLRRDGSSEVELAQ